jgi:hypothetical protein
LENGAGLKLPNAGLITFARLLQCERTDPVADPERHSNIAPSAEPLASPLALFLWYHQTVLAEIRREIEKAEKMEMKIRAARYNKVREILSRCDEQDILLLCRILKAGGAVPNGNATSVSEEKLADDSKDDSKIVAQTDARFQGLPETTLRGPLGPMTRRGRPRERAWGVLFPAVEQALDEVKEITSISIYEYLTERRYPFSTDRPVHSIAAILRKMAKNGGILIQVTHGKGQKPVLFRKREKRLVSMA